MATEINENRCNKCEGCLEGFCHSHMKDHRQQMNKQLDEIEINRGLIQQTLEQQRTKGKKHPLIQEIDQWEIESINKIKQKAEESRKIALSFTNEHITGIESQLNNLTDELNQSRQENDYSETNLNEWHQKLIQLKEELSKPLNIKINYISTPFITQIHVNIPVLDPTAIQDENVKYQNLTAILPSFEQKVQHIVANKLESIKNPLNEGKIVPPIVVGPNEGDRLHVLRVEKSERIIRLRGNQTNGQLMIMEGEILLGEGPPLHIHHFEDEYWYVLEGEIQFQLGEEKFIGKAGTWVYGPRGLKHTFRNINSPGARLQFIFHPAGMEHYFEEISRVMAAQDDDWEAQATAVAKKYGIEVVGIADWSGTMEKQTDSST